VDVWKCFKTGYAFSGYIRCNNGGWMVTLYDHFSDPRHEELSHERGHDTAIHICYTGAYGDILARRLYDFALCHAVSSDMGRNKIRRRFFKKYTPCFFSIRSIGQPAGLRREKAR
jgi:hypothetical protein